MNAKLRKIFSPDLNNVENFIPSNECFSFLIQAFIGPSKGKGEESFEFIICSPKWLKSELEKETIIFGKGLLIMTDFNFLRVSNFLSSLCERTHGNSWGEIATKLSRYGIWEFEDYVS